MAFAVVACWVLVLSACSVLTVRAECTRECALCLYGSVAPQHEDSSTGPCTLECRSSVDLRKLGLCRNALNEDERSTAEQKADSDSSEHLLAKKYGGFMKRYGGFMMKKNSDDPASDESDRFDEEELNVLKQIIKAGLSAKEPAKELQKRYGGFMRRVGRPQWLDEAKPYGVHKRWEDEGADDVLPETHKRYGGFMD